MPEKLIVMEQYYKKYCSMKHIPFDFCVRRSTICDAILWAEEPLIKSRTFRLPLKRKLLKSDSCEPVFWMQQNVKADRPQKNSADILLEKRNRNRGNVATIEKREKVKRKLRYDTVLLHLEEHNQKDISACLRPV